VRFFCLHSAISRDQSSDCAVAESEVSLNLRVDSASTR